MTWLARSNCPAATRRCSGLGGDRAFELAMMVGSVVLRGRPGLSVTLRQTRPLRQMVTYHSPEPGQGLYSTLAKGASNYAAVGQLPQEVCRPTRFYRGPQC